MTLIQIGKKINTAPSFSNRIIYFSNQVNTLIYISGLTAKQTPIFSYNKF